MNKINIVMMVLLPVCLVVSGCSFSRSSKSFSKSSKSISKSASSPSRWLSRSSHRDQINQENASKSFQDETVALTVLYARSGGTSQNFLRELSAVSHRHGIVDWENNFQTFTAIGIGLKSGGVSKESIKTLSFLQGDNIFDHYPQILSGYNLSKNIS